MIEIIKKNNSLPYKDFLEYYYDAIHAGQKNIEAVCISSLITLLKRFSLVT